MVRRRALDDALNVPWRRTSRFGGIEHARRSASSESCSRLRIAGRRPASQRRRRRAPAGRCVASAEAGVFMPWGPRAGSAPAGEPPHVRLPASRPRVQIAPGSSEALGRRLCAGRPSPASPPRRGSSQAARVSEGLLGGGGGARRPAAPVPQRSGPSRVQALELVALLRRRARLPVRRMAPGGRGRREVSACVLTPSVGPASGERLGQGTAGRRSRVRGRARLRAPALNVRAGRTRLRRGRRVRRSGAPGPAERGGRRRPAARRVEEVHEREAQRSTVARGPPARTRSATARRARRPGSDPRHVRREAHAAYDLA